MYVKCRLIRLVYYKRTIKELFIIIYYYTPYFSISNYFVLGLVTCKAFELVSEPPR